MSGPLLALGFKERYPEMFRDYVQRCKRGEVRLGQPYLWAPMFDQWILNFPTKDHQRSLTKREDIVSGMEYLARNFRDWGITSLAVPPLGCGEGKLEWTIVGPTLYRLAIQTKSRNAARGVRLSVVAFPAVQPTHQVRGGPVARRSAGQRLARSSRDRWRRRGAGQSQP